MLSWQIYFVDKKILKSACIIHDIFALKSECIIHDIFALKSEHQTLRESVRWEMRFYAAY